MVEMQAACFCKSGSTLNPCFRTLMSASGPEVLSLSLSIHDKNGYSLPPNHTPSVLPLKSAGVFTPLSARQVSIMPERLKTWAMLTSATPFSRVASADGRSEEHTSELESRENLVC